VFVSSHALTGAVIGKVTRRPGLAFVLGLASHLVMDAVPHWGGVDHDTFVSAARIDGLTMLGVAALVAAKPDKEKTAMLAGLAGAVLFDMDKPVRHFLNVELWPAPLKHFLGRIQTESPDKLVFELAFGVLLGVVFFTSLAVLDKTDPLKPSIFRQDTFKKFIHGKK